MTDRLTKAQSDSIRAVGRAAALTIISEGEQANLTPTQMLMALEIGAAAVFYSVAHTDTDLAGKMAKMLETRLLARLAEINSEHIAAALAEAKSAKSH
jgi:hypothetical protein